MVILGYPGEISMDAGTSDGHTVLAMIPFHLYSLSIIRRLW